MSKSSTRIRLHLPFFAALIVAVAPEVGQITSDRRRVEQILLNLVNNALKFTEQGEVRLKCRVSQDRLVTQVVDTGLELSRKVFQNVELLRHLRPRPELAEGMPHSSL